MHMLGVQVLVVHRTANTVFVELNPVPGDHDTSWGERVSFFFFLLSFVEAWKFHCTASSPATHFLVIVLTLLALSPPSPQIKIALPPRSRYLWIASIWVPGEWSELMGNGRNICRNELHQPLCRWTFHGDRRKKMCPLYAAVPVLILGRNWRKHNSGEMVADLVCLRSIYGLTLCICECWNAGA